jgi:hypothetical protein
MQIVVCPRLSSFILPQKYRDRLPLKQPLSLIASGFNESVNKVFSRLDKFKAVAR